MQGGCEQGAHDVLLADWGTWWGAMARRMRAQGAAVDVEARDIVPVTLRARK